MTTAHINTATHLGDSPVVIDIHDLNKWYGQFHVLKEINLQIRQQEKVVICGPSGSGKSTLIRTINRLEEHQEGRIVVDGEPLTNDVKQIERVRREVGMVFQQFNLFPHMTILDNVISGPIHVRNMPRKQALDLAHSYLKRVGIAEQANKYPGQLSGGQQQRVAIARALANDPAIILADEPTGNLDLSTGEEIIKLMNDLSKDRGVTIITATHDYKMLNASDRVVWIEDGLIKKIEQRDQLNIDVGCIRMA